MIGVFAALKLLREFRLAERVAVPAQALCGRRGRQARVPQTVDYVRIGQRFGIGMRLLAEEINRAGGRQLRDAVVFVNRADAVGLERRIGCAVDDRGPGSNAGDGGGLRRNMAGNVCWLDQRRQNRDRNPAHPAKIL